MKRLILKGSVLFFLIQSGCAAADVTLQTTGTPMVMTPTAKPDNAPEALWYQVKGNGVVGVTEDLIVRVKDDTVLKALAAKYDLKVKRALMKGVYLLSGPDRNRTIGLCNTLTALPGVVYAEPDFIQEMKAQ